MNELQIKQEAEQALALEREVAAKVAALKETQDKITATWKEVEAAMIENNIKQVKGDWGVLTIAERLNWSVDMEILPAKFRKVVADTTKISTEFRLYGKEPKGCIPSYKKYLTKRLKGVDND